MRNQEENGLPAYVGGIHPNCDYFHGQIPYAKGVHLTQVARANRGRPEADDGTGHTYKHAPDLTWYHGSFYIQYLTNPEDEHGGAGVSVLASSADGREWGDFRISFPEYWIPPCEVTDAKGRHHVFDGSKPAFMHQRMAFFRASNDVMLLSGFYGWSPALWMTNWDCYGVGRVVRRLFPDGSLGEIFFIKVNWQGGWQKEDLRYPLYEESTDAEFVAACRELLSDSLYVQQWAEENGDADPAIRIKHPQGGTWQAFCWYHRSKTELVGLWKHSYVSVSHDGGESWEAPKRSPGLVMSGQKIWGCRTGDGRFALVYDPTLETQHRFPLCIVTSEDGLNFDHMRLVCGEVPPIRYRGFCKDLGPQYMRGICERLPRPDGDLYLTYSLNKEDIWFAQIPVPVTGEQTENVRNLSFTEKTLREWNLYRPFWAHIGIEGGELRIEDREPYDYARLTRLLPPSARVMVKLGICVEELKEGQTVQLELANAVHQTAVRLIFRPQGRFNHRTVCELGLGEWKAGEELQVGILADCRQFSYQVWLESGGAGTAEASGATETKSAGQAEASGAAGSEAAGQAEVLSAAEREAAETTLPYRFMAAVNEISEFSLRTGEARYLANLEENPDNKPEVPLPGCEEKAEAVRVRLISFEAVRLSSRS